MRSKDCMVSKKKFDLSINRIAKIRKNNASLWFISRHKYKKLLAEVKSVRQKKLGELDSKAVKLIKKFDVVTSEGEERLVVPNSTKNLVYIPKEELFAVITKVHIDTNHGKLPDMMKCLKTRYKNVGNEAVAAYLEHCQDCPKKPTRPRNVAGKDSTKSKVDDESKENEGARENGIETPKSRNRQSKKNQSTNCEDAPGAQNPAANTNAPTKQVRVTRPVPASASTMPLTAGTRTTQRFEIIDMSACCNCDFNYLAVLRESTTRFVHLKPMREKCAEELACILTPVFTCFGIPSAIQTTDNIFIKSALETIYSRSPVIPQDIVVEQPPKDKFPGDVESLMFSWVCHNSAPRWHSGLQFTQYVANLTFNKEIEKTPFEAMFGRKGKLGVSKLNLPSELVIELRPDGDLVIETQKNESLDDRAKDDADVDISEMLEVVLTDVS